jgi:hypothetical protein
MQVIDAITRVRPLRGRATRQRTQHRVAFTTVFVVLLAACGGGGGSSASAFCGKVATLSEKYGGLSDNPTPSLVKQAATAAQQLVGGAPSVIKTAVKTEADAYSQYAKSGDDTALTSDAFSGADDQITNWESDHCKQSQ